jgi:protein TonB
MKTIKFTIAVLLTFMLSISVNAQWEEKMITMLESDPIKESLFLEMVPPGFIGGHEALETYISDNLKYPPLAIRQGLEGTVFVMVKITSEGKIMDAIIKKSCKPILDEAALDLIKGMPQWNPVTQGNNTIETYYQLPITFSLK